MKILVPVDGGNTSQNAAIQAAETAESEGSLIRLAAVVKGKDIRTYERYAKLWQYADGSAYDKKIRLIDTEKAAYMLTHEASRMLDSVASHLVTTKSRIEKTVLHGHPLKQIIAAAQNDKFDMIVVGKNGFNGFKARRLIKKSPCPVLVTDEQGAIHIK
jgi:nucleotide-binding universal stress UspA family protein